MSDNPKYVVFSSLTGLDNNVLEWDAEAGAYRHFASVGNQRVRAQQIARTLNKEAK